MEDDGDRASSRADPNSAFVGSGEHFNYGATANVPSGRKVGGPAWGCGAWAIFACRLIMLAVIIVCICWIRIQWTCTSEEIADVQETTFLVARTEEMLSGWREQTSKSFAENFTVLNEIFKTRVEEMTRTLSQLQANLTELVTFQGQQIDEISATNDRTVRSVSSFDSTLTATVNDILNVTSETVTTLKTDIDQRGASQRVLLSSVWDSANEALTGVASVAVSATEASETVGEVDNTVPEGLELSFGTLLDSQQILVSVSNTTSADQQQASDTMHKNMEDLNATANSLMTEVLKKTDDLKDKQQELHTGQLSLQQSQVTIRENLNNNLMSVYDTLAACKATEPRQAIFPLTACAVIVVFLSDLQY